MVWKGHAKFLSSFVLNIPWKNDDGAVIRALNITTPVTKNRSLMQLTFTRVH